MENLDKALLYWEQFFRALRTNGDKTDYSPSSVADASHHLLEELADLFSLLQEHEKQIKVLEFLFLFYQNHASRRLKLSTIRNRNRYTYYGSSIYAEDEITHAKYAAVVTRV